MSSVSWLVALAVAAGEEVGDLRDLGPHDDAGGIAQVVEVLVVLVVRETDRGRAESPG